MNKIVIAICLIGLAIGSHAQVVYSLDNIINLAKGQSPLAKQAETRKENRFWQYRLFKSNYNPQLALNGNLPAYSNQFIPVTQEDGSTQFRPVEQTNSSLNLGLFQPISPTGGSVSVNTRASQFQDLVFDETRWRSTIVDLTVNQPIFAFNDLKWDKKIEPIRYEESKRGYVEEMEFVSRTAVDRFFDYLDAQVNYQIAQFNLANNDTIYNIEKGRYNIGTASEDKLLQVELQLLRSQQDLAQAQLDLQTSRLALRTFIGLNEGQSFDLALPEEIPIFPVNEDLALQYAKDNRSDFIAFERRRIEADARVAEAKGERFQMNLNASFGLNSAGGDFNESYQNAQNQQFANLTLNIPIVNWGRNEARMKTALANKQLTDYVIAQEEQNFEQEIITQVRQLEVLRQQIEISKKSDEVAQKRYEVAQNRYLIGKIDITNLNIALTEKDTAKRSYISALRTYWIAYYDLRRLTLYDFSNNSLLYSK
ncbi:Outer membrane protein TolC [Ekhidna lutea]|uniref:Outer membrane protein TolC n=1 Tax=Ekhidna lutea TaxID=447679 RepID=A0A239HGE1_EKHLU|nr:TolC family protein [Ekhidna lutea]SNS80211.1 Outer membrane protein TolC [Ekhidna lutea]